MIKTTHVGSLPRTKIVSDLLFAREKNEPFEQKHYDEIMKDATIAIIKQQKDIGISIPSDGETSKISYATYIKDRLTGFEGDSPRSPPADLLDYPTFLEKLAKQGGTPQYRRPRNVSEITLKTLAPLDIDIENMQAGLTAAGFSKGFMNSASPGVIALFQPSDYYKNLDDYLEAIAEGMRHEYEAIVKAGLILQIDAPDLGLGKHMMYKELDEKGFLKRLDVHLEVLNHALRNIDGQNVRMHICWGNYEGPHTHDIELKKVLPSILKAKPRALLFEASNPRHAHEWVVWKDIKAPQDFTLIPGCLDSTTNFVEHPELVAQRLDNFVKIVGKERVIAGTDCGFSTFAGFGAVDPAIAAEKLKSLVKGAEIASKRN